MRRAFVIGHPVAHSRSPLIHGHWLERLGIEGSYQKLDVRPDDLPVFLSGLKEAGFAGGNVTIPHKEAAFRLADVPTEHARRLGAVNTLWLDDEGRLCADNTDGPGFVANLDQVTPGWSGSVRTALIIGAGGAARAIVGALLDRGIERIAVANRTAASAEGIARFDPARISVHPLDVPDRVLAGADLLVNTTQLGMAGQPSLDLDLGALPDTAIVADIVYVPLETPLLAAARRRGLEAVDGLGMLLHQAVPGFERWFGRRPEVTPELRALVERDIEAARP